MNTKKILFPELTTDQIEKIRQGAKQIGTSLALAAQSIATFAQTAAFSEAFQAYIAQQQKIERDLRWKDDPMELKKRFIDPVVSHCAEQLRMVADWMDGEKH